MSPARASGAPSASPPRRGQSRKALRADDRLGGHIVTGHVDGVGEVLKFEAIEESHELVIRAPRVAGYIARKGLDHGRRREPHGESRGWHRLLDQPHPHTIAVTTLKRLQPGARVNLEIDIIARYVERMQAWREAGG